MNAPPRSQVTQPSKHPASYAPAAKPAAGELRHLSVADIAAIHTSIQEAAYRWDVRSDAMAQALLSESAGARKFAVLVVGGFHAERIKKLLKNNNVAYAMFEPRFSPVAGATGSEYLTAFQRDKTPLEKKIYGDRLFLADGRTVLGGSQVLSQPGSSPRRRCRVAR